MIETQINGLAHAQDLSLDIMAFTIVKQLVDSTESMLDAEANVAPWLQNLTEFASQFFKKYHSVDMLGLLTLLLHKMRDEDSYILGFVLHQLIVKLFGWSDHDQPVARKPTQRAGSWVRSALGGPQPNSTVQKEQQVKRSSCQLVLGCQVGRPLQTGHAADGAPGTTDAVHLEQVLVRRLVAACFAPVRQNASLLFALGGHSDFPCEQ